MYVLYAYNNAKTFNVDNKRSIFCAYVFIGPNIVLVYKINIWCQNKYNNKVHEFSWSGFIEL